MTPEVNAAIEEIRNAFPGKTIDVAEDQNGGAYVVVHDLDIGDQYIPNTTWIGFQITYQYYHADVYPHYIDSGIRRCDGKDHVSGFHLNRSFPGRKGQSAIMISRRSNHWDPTTDTAAIKLEKVLDWIRQQ